MAALSSLFHLTILIVAQVLPAATLGEDAPSTSISADLLAAIRSGAAEKLATLLDGGARVDARDADGNTPLILAALLGNTETVDLLLRRGADPNASNKAGVTPLVRAATDYEKARRLLAAGTKADARTALGNTPLILAARKNGNSPTVKLLLDRGADAKDRNLAGSSALHAAAASGDLATVQLLLDRGADVNDSPGKELNFLGMRTPLMWAALHDDLPMMRALLDRGADVNAATPFGTPLSHACWHGNIDAARLLLERGADVNARQDFPGYSPLHWAAGLDSPRPQLVQLLLARGADPSAGGGDTIDFFLGVPQTPLLLAEKRGRTAIVEALEAGGARSPAPSAAPASREKVSKAAVDSADRDQLVAIVERAIALLQASAARSHESYVRHASKQDCTSCHQHYLPAAAVSHARERSLRCDEAAASEGLVQIQRTGTSALEKELQVTFHPEPSYHLGYAAFALAEAKVPQGTMSDLIVHTLATIQLPDGRWSINLPRPPMQSGDVGSTALAVRALRTYGWPARQAELDACVERGRRWLRAVDPETTDGAVFQLLGLHWAGDAAEKLAPQAAALIRTQRDDGGWSQLPTLESDGYATGQALYALARAAKVPVSNPAWQRGLKFLLASRRDDGTWHATRRAFPFQPNMVSGFPHGRDSWLSAATTSWAVLAILEAIEPGARGDRPAALASRAETSAKPALLAAEPVDFVRQVQPVLERSCLGCHGPERHRSEFRVDGPAEIVKGGVSGDAAIVPGSSERSPLVQYVCGLVEGMEMPPPAHRARFPALTADEQRVVRAWVDQGAAWPKGAVLRAQEKPAAR